MRTLQTIRNNDPARINMQTQQSASLINRIARKYSTIQRFKWSHQNISNPGLREQYREQQRLGLISDNRYFTDTSLGTYHSDNPYKLLAPSQNLFSTLTYCHASVSTSIESSAELCYESLRAE